MITRDKLKKIAPVIFRSKMYFFLRGFIFEFFEKITGYRMEKKQFEQEAGYDLDIKNPKSFTHKVVWKKIYDRNPLLPITADKYKVRKYIEYCLGKKSAERILVPLLYVTDKPKTIPFRNLPEEYIVKANHRSGDVIIVEKGEEVVREHIIAKCKKWLREPYGLFFHEWAYQKIERKIIVEQLLKDENGMLPKDYKFFIFHGKCEMVQLFGDRFSNKELSLSTFTPEGRFLPFKWGRYRTGEKTLPQPENYPEMLRMAERLGKDFEFVRVDLYSVCNRTYFGEFTHYPHTGYLEVTPRSVDFEFGLKWNIVPKYWKLK